MENFDLYKDIKIKKFELSDGKGKFNVVEDFDKIDSYQNNIKKYIYTGIKLSDYTESKEKAFQSRLQLLMSAVLCRSLLLKNGIAESLNCNNFPSYYAILKSFLEVQALLGYVWYVVNKEKDFDKIILEINKLKLGNRKAGSYKVGNVEAVNVLTMFDRCGEVLRFLEIKDGKSINLLREEYENICNFGHINFDAHLCVVKLETKKGNIYNLKADADGYKKGLYSFYMPAFVGAINRIEFICSLIVKNKKVDNFNLLKSKYFLK